MKEIACPLQVAAQKHNSEIAIVSGQKTIPYGDLNLYVENTCDQVQKIKIKKGDRVAILSENSCEYITLLFALWRCEVIACLLNTKNPAKRLKEELEELDCSLLVVSSNLKEVTIGLDVKTVEIESLVSFDVGTEREEKTVSSGAFATILFTSGSSAQPKAVVHTYGNHDYSAKGSNENIPVQPGDKWCVTLPFYHVGGLSILFRCLLGGGTVVVGLPDDELMEIIRAQKVTHVSFVATQLIRLLDDTANADVLKKLNAILLGGGFVPAGLIEKSKALGLNVYTSYGLTEMASQVATTSQDSCFGARVLKYRDLKISEEGEILVKGETLFEGYWQNGTITLPVDEQGWFATGDLGELDKKGALTVTGRKDNMFISGGENICPEEIERQILMIDGIEEAIIVPIRHEEFGERPAAFIKFREGKPIPSEKIITHLKTIFPPHKIPRQIFFWPEDLVQTGIKVNRAELMTD